MWIPSDTNNSVFLDLSLQDDGTFGIDAANLRQMSPDELNLNVFDDQGLGEAGAPRLRS